ncbi:MAG TPA: PAS domain-containing protein [Dongiaceae bacterium]|nr:PAS domain-containing protein [Dongiaceae bacterium]
MKPSWDISFLLDTQGRIEEARGNCLEILGHPVRTLIGQSFLPFIAGADRAHFRRFLSQLGNANAVRRAMLHLWTSNHSDQAFLMEAQNGWSTERYWIMLALPKDQTGGNSLESLDAPIPATSDDDLLMLIELAAAEATPLDLTIISVGGLAAPQSAAAQSAELADELQRRVERSLIAHAYDGVVSKSEPGVYNVLHDALTPAEKIAGDVRAGAREIGVSEAQLGLTQRTVKLGSKPSRARIEAAMASVRAPIQDRSLPVGDPGLEPQPASRPIGIYIALGAVVLVALVAAFAYLLLR